MADTLTTIRTILYSAMVLTREWPAIIDPETGEASRIYPHDSFMIVRVTPTDGTGDLVDIYAAGIAGRRVAAYRVDAAGFVLLAIRPETFPAWLPALHAVAARHVMSTALSLSELLAVALPALDTAREPRGEATSRRSVVVH